MYIFEKTDNDMAGVYIIYKGTPQNEDHTNYGISHLLEHMIYGAISDIEEVYDENGIDGNAFTGKSEVVFYIQGLSEKINQFKDDYVNRIINYVPKIEDFEKEINIVKQEYNDYFNQGINATYINYMSKNYGYVFSIGTKEALDSITFEDVVAFKNKYYSNPSMIIVADKTPSTISYNSFKDMTPSTYEKYTYINTDAQLNDLSMIYMGTSSPINFTNKDYNLRVIKKMLGMGLKSPLYQEMREKRQLCYWVSCDDENILDMNILTILTSGTSENRSTIEKNIYDVLSNPDKYMTKDRFNLVYNNIKTAYDISAQYKHDFNWINKFYCRDESSVAKNIEKIRYDEVMDYYNTYILPSSRSWNFMSQKDFYEV